MHLGYVKLFATIHMRGKICCFSWALVKVSVYRIADINRVNISNGKLVQSSLSGYLFIF